MMTPLIWLDEKSNADFGFVVARTSQRPALPGTVDRTLAIPGRHGLYDFGADLSARQFVIECAFVSSRNSLELQQQVMSLARYLVDYQGKPRELELRFRERPDQFFRVRFLGSLDVDRIVGTGIFSLPLTAFDPFAYSDRETLVEQVMMTSPYQMAIESKGNVSTEPVITLTNEGDMVIRGFRLTNEYQIDHD